MILTFLFIHCTVIDTAAIFWDLLCRLSLLEGLLCDVLLLEVFLEGIILLYCVNVCSVMMYCITIYSGTSDSGPSEIGTQYNRPLYKGHRSRSQKFVSL